MDLRLAPERALALRMSSLLLGTDAVGPRRRSVKSVVEWFGAMQAQDIASGMWSFGVRLPGQTHSQIHAALEARQALRTWPMRGTVHFVPTADAKWMLELMAGRPKRAAGRARAALGLTDALVDTAIDVLTAALRGGGRLTRAECMATLTNAGVDVSGQRGYHLLAYASQSGHTCIAPQLAGEQSFALLAEWAPRTNEVNREEGLRLMAVRYFRGHGPASRADFAGWTGLTSTDAKAGMAAAVDELVPVRVDGMEMIVHRTVLASGDEAASGVQPLPGFDEYMLGFKDRSLALADEHRQAIVPGGNGVFQPTIVCEGRVIGTWRRSAGRSRTTVTVRPLVRITAKDRSRIEEAFQPYAEFLSHEVAVTWATG